MVIGIRPTVDFAFKMMLGSPDHSNVTIHFLNAILVGQPRIARVQILNPFIPKESEDDKFAVLDILATDEHGRLLNIEMQTSLPAELPQRLAYYASCLYSEQLTEGIGYLDLQPAITICVLTQSMFPSRQDLHLDFRLREQSGLQLTDNLQIHLLELPKLRTVAENVYYASPVEQWAFFLLHAEHLTTEDIERFFPDSAFAEAAGVLTMIARTPEERRHYDARLKFHRDEESRLRRAHQEGLDLGREEGVRLGRIVLLQQLLELPEFSQDDLLQMSAEALTNLEAQLQQQLRSRDS